MYQTKTTEMLTHIYASKIHSLYLTNKAKIYKFCLFHFFAGNANKV